MDDWINLKPGLWHLTVPAPSSQINEEPWTKIAMFDLDHTLVKPLGKKIHPKNADDWEWMFHANEKLTQLAKSGYHLVIISNQAGVGENIKSREFIFQRIHHIVDQLDLPIDVYVSTTYGPYRKPEIGTFQEFIFPKIDISHLQDLVYVGDAAGRPQDFADSDRRFAYNIHLFLKHISRGLPTGDVSRGLPTRDVSRGLPTDIKFYTPEEFFLGKKPVKRKWQGFQPQQFLKSLPKNQKLNFLETLEKDSQKGKQILLILVGPPASGKTTLSQYLQKKIPIKHVSQDCSGSKAKCAAEFVHRLKKGENIILDNTNPSREVRRDFIEQAKQINPQIQIYILHLDVSKELAAHLNAYRERCGGKKIPTIAFNVFYKKFEEPEAKSEQVHEVFRVPFIPRFKTDENCFKFLMMS